MNKKISISGIFFWITMFFFYIPIIMLIFYSFNKGKTSTFTGFSLKWYIELFTRSNKLWEVFFRSLMIAITSSVFATLIATFGAIGIKWYNFKIKSYLKIVNYIPLILPDLIIGVSLLLFFNINVSWYKGIPLGITTIFIAHTTFNIPFALLTLMSRLDEFDYSIVEAARDLGATEYEALKKVILPTMIPGIVSAILMSLTLSLDDFVITSFVTGANSDTLPIQIYSMLKFGVTPVVNALSTILVIITFIATLSSKKIQKYIIN